MRPKGLRFNDVAFKPGRAMLASLGFFDEIHTPVITSYPYPRIDAPRQVRRRIVGLLVGLPIQLDPLAEIRA